MSQFNISGLTLSTPGLVKSKAAFVENIEEDKKQKLMIKCLRIAAEIVNPLLYTSFMIIFSFYSVSLNE